MYKQYKRMNERGYTLLEAIIQLLIFMLFTQFTIVVIASTVQLVSTERAHKQLDFELFVSELNTYLTRSTKFTMIDKTFQMDNINRIDTKKTYIFSSSANNVRLTTLEGGNIIMLPNAKNAPVLQLNDHHMKVSVKFKDETMKERIFIVPNK